jgi:hypothetical protein
MAAARRNLPPQLEIRDKFCHRCGGNQLQRPITQDYARKGQLFCRGCHTWIKEADIDSHAPSPDQFYEWLNKSKSNSGTPFDQVSADLGISAEYLRRFCNGMQRIHGDVRKEIVWGVKKDSSIKKAACKVVPRPWAPPVEKGIPLWDAIHLLSVAMNHEQQLELCRGVKDGSLNLSQEIANEMKPLLEQGKGVRESYVLATTRSEKTSLLYGMQLAMIGGSEFVKSGLIYMGFDSATASKATRSLIELGIIETLGFLKCHSVAAEFEERIKEFVKQARKEGKISANELAVSAREMMRTELNMRSLHSWSNELKRSISEWVTKFCSDEPSTTTID